MTLFLQPSISLRSLRKGFQFSSSSSFLHSGSIGLRSFSCKMSADSPIPSQSITLHCQLEQPVQILAAPGVSDSDFRQVQFLLQSSFSRRNYFDFIFWGFLLSVLDISGMLSIHRCSNSGW